MRVAVFTDTLDEVNGVGRFLAAMMAEARGKGVDLDSVHTCSAAPDAGSRFTKKFLRRCSRCHDALLIPVCR